MKEIEDLILPTEQELNDASSIVNYLDLNRYNIYIGTQSSIQNILDKINNQNIDIDLSVNLFVESESAPSELTVIKDNKLKAVVVKRLGITL